MPIEEFNSLWSCITIIEAQDMLTSLTVSDWPNMSKSARQKLHKNLYRQAYPAIFRESKEITVDTLARMMGG